MVAILKAVEGAGTSVPVSAIRIVRQAVSRRRNDNRSMLGPIWANLGHFGLPELAIMHQLDVESLEEDGQAVLTRGSMTKTFHRLKRSFSLSLKPLHIIGIWKPLSAPPSIGEFLTSV